MKILFITRLFAPHIGGVEKHVYEVSKSLINCGNQVTVLTEKFDKNLKDNDFIDGINVIRFSYPHKKYIGILFIWLWFWNNRSIFFSNNVVHCHDVFIWYLPFRILFPKKKVITTVHGFEWNNPLSLISLWQKKMTIRLSNKSVGVGDFLEKYLRKKFSLIIYGAVSPQTKKFKKTNNLFVYVGRLEVNTGLLRMLNWLKKNLIYKIEFCGDGELRKICNEYGKVYGFCDPNPFYKKANFCIPGGYLAALEALSYGCQLKLFWNNKVKEDYWKMSPFFKLESDKLIKWAKEQTWEKIANEYLNLYNSI